MAGRRAQYGISERMVDSTLVCTLVVHLAGPLALSLILTHLHARWRLSFARAFFFLDNRARQRPRSKVLRPYQMKLTLRRMVPVARFHDTHPQTSSHGQASCQNLRTTLTWSPGTVQMTLTTPRTGHSGTGGGSPHFTPS